MNLIEWKTGKRKVNKGHKPRMFNEKEVGCKPVSKDMDKIGNLFWFFTCYNTLCLTFMFRSYIFHYKESIHG